jgi:hypothetical protein
MRLPHENSRTARLPPFYTHGIGSLPRPQVVRDLLAPREGMPPDRFQRVVDEFVRFVIRLEEQVLSECVASDIRDRRS